MPNSCRSIIKKCLFKGAISETEADQLLRNVLDVRCEDCKYYGGKMTYQHPYKECTRHHCLSAPNDFCSKAERKDHDNMEKS